MSNVNIKRKRWNAIGFILSLVYFFVVIGLLMAKRKIDKELDVIPYICGCICVFIIIFLIFKCIINKRLKNNK